MFIRLHIYRYNEETRNGSSNIVLADVKGQGGIVMREIKNIRELKKYVGNKVVRKLHKKEFKVEGRTSRNTEMKYAVYPELVYQELKFFYTTKFGTKMYTGYARRCTPY